MLNKTGKFLTMLALLALVAPTATQAQNCNKNPDHPKCAGDGQATTPSIVTFRDDPGDGLQSDGDLIYGPEYTHGEPTTDDLRVFIGSAANEGNIKMQFGPDHTFPAVVVRGFTLDFSNPGGDPNTGVCLPAGGSEFVVPHFLKVDVNDFISQGIFGLTTVGATSLASMTVRFFDAEENPYFLNFTPVNSGPCQGQWDLVSVARTSIADPSDPGSRDVWTVSVSDGPLGACLEKSKTGKGKNGTPATFCGAYNLPGEFYITPCLDGDGCGPEAH